MSSTAWDVRGMERRKFLTTRVSVRGFNCTHRCRGRKVGFRDRTHASSTAQPVTSRTGTPRPTASPTARLWRRQRLDHRVSIAKNPRNSAISSASFWPLHELCAESRGELGCGNQLPAPPSASGLITADLHRLPTDAIATIRMHSICERVERTQLN